MIADSISNMTSNTTEILCTKHSHVVSNTRSLTDNLQPCSQEEANTRLLLHVRDIASSGLKKIMIITSVTDVVVIELYIFHSLFIEKLWIEFGAGKHRRWLPIHLYAALLREEICRALPLFIDRMRCRFFFCWSREENCMGYMGSLSRGNRMLCQVRKTLQVFLH